MIDVKELREQADGRKPLNLNLAELRELLDRLEAAERAAMSRGEREAAWAALRMVREAVGELFGPVASIESEEAVLRRGPEYHHEAEAIIAALRRVHDYEQVLAAHVRSQAEEKFNAKR